MSLKSLNKLLVGLSFFACTSVFAVPLVVNLNGIQSYGEFGDPVNTVMTYNVGANATITGLTYDVNLTARSPSWLSELGLAFTNNAVTDGVLLNPGFEDEFAGTANYSDTLDLVAEGLSFNVDSDGILRLEFYEDWDDSGVNPDGIWNFGTLTFEVVGGTPDVPGVPTDPGQVPEPATALLMAAGLGMLGYGRRRAAAKGAATT